MVSLVVWKHPTKYPNEGQSTAREMSNVFDSLQYKTWNLREEKAGKNTFFNKVARMYREGQNIKWLPALVWEKMTQSQSWPPA